MDCLHRNTGGYNAHPQDACRVIGRRFTTCFAAVGVDSLAVPSRVFRLVPLAEPGAEQAWTQTVTERAVSAESMQTNRAPSRLAACAGGDWQLVAEDCRPPQFTHRMVMVNSSGIPSLLTCCGRGDRGPVARRLRGPGYIAKSLYSGFTNSVGGYNMPEARVWLVPCSMRMKEPVSRFCP